MNKTAESSDKMPTEETVENVDDASGTLKTALEESVNAEQNTVDSGHNDSDVFGNVEKTTETDTTGLQEQVTKENIELNNAILDGKLMPELLLNEQQKRKLKVVLLVSVFFFILAQITVMSVFIGQVVYTLTLGVNKYSISETMSTELMAFMKFYITVTLCEFIAMLFFIVRYVFDKSIFELIKLFKTDTATTETETEIDADS